MIPQLVSIDGGELVRLALAIPRSGSDRTFKRLYELMNHLVTLRKRAKKARRASSLKIIKKNKIEFS
jgi:hypothetical protein